MSRLICTLLAIITLAASFYGQRSNDIADEALVLPDLGLRYTPPPGMTDNTTDASRQARERANSYATKAEQLLLDASSGEADSPDWRQLWVVHFPRAQLTNLNEWMAEAKVNNALAGPHGVAEGQPQSATFAGHSFLVSDFKQEEPPLTKHARIFTTVCKTQLISFVFVSNSAEGITEMENSLKSLKFSGN